MTSTLHTLLTPARLICAASLLCLVACSGGTGSSASGMHLPDGVTVTPAREVRQGQAGITLIFEQASGGLSNPTHVGLGDLEFVVDPSSTDQRLQLTVNVPHGAITGGRALTIETAGGTINKADVIDVTPITAGPSGDDSNLGSTSAPFRTLKQALAVAGSNDTCVLAAGTYDVGAGETWGYTPPGALTISGDSTAGTVLQGPAAAALTPSGTLTVQNLSFSGFDAAVRVTDGAQVSLNDVALSGDGEGAVLAGASSGITLTRGTVDSGYYGIELGDTCDHCALNITGTTLTESGYGPIVQVSKSSLHSSLTLNKAVLKGGTFVADAFASVSIQGSTLTGNGANAALNFRGATLDTTGSTFTAGSGPYGINLETGVITLTDATVQGNQYGVYQLGGSSTVRNTKISGYSSIGLYFASGDLDLGTASEAGNNSFKAAADGAFGLYVDTSTSPLTCSNTSFDGVVPATSVVLDSGTDLLQEPHEYVLTPTKTISFYNVR